MNGYDADVVVIGGGAAGLNGALMLVRSRRQVIVVDAGEPRNAPAHGVHGLLGREGMPPAELLAAGRSEVQGYGGAVVQDRVTSLRRDDASALVVTLRGGRVLRARRVLIATGLVDVLPPIPGMADLWGVDVLHCPYCHGWEVRDTAIGVLATGPASPHHGLLFRQLSDDIVYFTNGMSLPADLAEQFAALDVTVVDGVVTALDTRDGRLTGVRLDDGSLVARTALAVATTLQARVDFARDIGLVPVEHSMGVGHHIPAGPTGQTDTAGVWVAGNVTDLMAQVGASAAQGALAGAHINADLVAEDARRAVQARAAVS
ncbi:NAD(P)/FAD-dependent oxidoreductase [Williamsia deligens]|uniref:NAD(P)/FAD-dependent oxidoreductase n=1 Tax=Williamsia deligens TaxID=321325 RepID=A0ABW3GA71_9NOCA|nr:NAD(P)/FAD-dependent oxidoreductase [Williamsia deligens]MCP2196039.1 Thioredoxin reductase [Williamsia deligens]